MKTRTISFYNNKKPKSVDLEVEVSSAGDILSCLGYCIPIDDLVDCMEGIKKSRDWCERIQAQFDSIDWDDVDARDPEPRDVDEWKDAPLNATRPA